MTNDIGTWSHMAPEVMRGENVNELADVYSFSIMLWEFTFGRPPFYGMEGAQIVYMVGLKKERPELIDRLPSRLVDLVESCWADDPDDRLDSTRIIGHLDSCKEDEEFLRAFDDFLRSRDVWEKEIEEFIADRNSNLSFK